MSRSEKRKRSRQSTAAYGASQPLFTALDNALQHVEEQKTNLTTARDLVQNLHVGVMNTTAIDDETRHRQYMNSAVKAWRTATHVYTDVFQALADLTAAQPHEGREERPGHTHFAVLAETAAMARLAANACRLFEDVAMEQAPAAPPSRAAASVEVEMKDAAGEVESNEEPGANEQIRQETNGVSKPEPTRPVSSTTMRERPPKREPPVDGSTRPKKKVRRTEQQPKAESPERKINIEPEAEQAAPANGVAQNTEQDAARAQKNRERRKKKQANRAARAKAEVANIPPIKFESIAPATNGEHQPSRAGAANGTSLNGNHGATSGVIASGVEYEDINGEVDERIKAKQEQTEAAKKAKKRKRASGDSFGVDTVNGNGTTSTEKRIKVESGAEPAAKQERKKHGREGEAAVKIEGQKKKRIKTET